jgi:predicted O-linked N-acetylglucosamine transferase (SPINDLY family)
VSQQTDRQVATAIRRDEIDILVNLNGYFGAERSGVFALRPAPLQLNYLGYPGTLGASYIDYIVADRWVVPGDQRDQFSERIAYLPHSYQCNDRKKATAGRSFTRVECGLPENGFVFCCFNNNYKIMPEIFGIWMNLLRGTPGSVLWLLEGNAAVKMNLKREAERRGVASERLVFASYVKLDEHLTRYRLVDLFLDTLPHNAHTTASDALWMGVPVVTCVGSTFAGRVAASLLTAIGLQETITSSLADYEELALRLAQDPQFLNRLRARLAANRDRRPLFDTAGFTHHLEAAYKTMWRRHESGLPPETFFIEPDTE